MDETRRRLLRGIVAAPFVITTPGLLMPVRPLWTPWTPWAPHALDTLHGYEYGGIFVPAMWQEEMIRVFRRDTEFRRFLGSNP